MNVAMPPVDGSGQEGVENQRTWPKLCPVCCARATNLFSAAPLSVGLGILTPGDGSISSREKSAVVSAAALWNFDAQGFQGLFDWSEGFTQVCPTESQHIVSGNPFFSPKSAYFRCVGLFVSESSGLRVYKA